MAPQRLWGRKMTRILITTVAAALLAGCAQTVWVKPGATESDFAHDRAVCDYQSELATPSTNIYNSAGSMNDAIADGIASGIADGIRKGTLMQKCMIANGWVLQRVKAPPASYGDPTARVVVGPPGNQSVLDGTGRYIGPAQSESDSEWSKGYTYRKQVVGATCKVPPGNSPNPAEWPAGCLAAEKSDS